MGIQRFGARLRGHATKKVLGSTASPAHNAAAIIDGPGLAHFVYYNICHERGTSTADISYVDVVAATSSWLDGLRAIGYRVEAILFDGGLPAYKKDVRIARLQAYVERVLAYKQSVSNGPPVLRGKTRAVLPPPPFLVFAVVEELLRHSVYGEVTYVVPGEADPYCVAAAQALAQASTEEDIVIFSDDADLLIYGLNERTNVAPFRDLNVSTSGSIVTWTADHYCPAQIATKGASPLSDLIRPAFIMAQDPHCTFESALRDAATSQHFDTAEFTEFAKSFSTSHETVEWGRLADNGSTKAESASRDSRVSELFQQLQQGTDCDSDGVLRMYLPFLLDDPSRKTAWTVDEDIRLLAYSVLTQSFGRDVSVQEYRRSGARLVAVLLEPLSSDVLETRLQRLLDQFKSIPSSEAVDVEDGWRCFVMRQVCQSLHASGYALPSLEDMVSVMSAKAPRSWSVIQFSAQYQASYYALRMLKQIAEYSSGQTAGGGSDSLRPLVRLQEHLKEMPSIGTFFGPSPGMTEGTKLALALQEILAHCQPEQDETRGNPRKKVKISRQHPSDGILAKNPFAMLADDGDGSTKD